MFSNNLCKNEGILLLLKDLKIGIQAQEGEKENINVFIKNGKDGKLRMYILP